MDLNKLKAFAEVAEQGSLSKAAFALEIAQSAVSRQITQLERDFGGRLFHRTGRGVVPTHLGQQMLPLARAVLREVAHLERAVNNSSLSPAGVVRFGSITSMVQPLVRSLFRKVQETYPSITLHILEGPSGQLDEWLVDGQIDVALLLAPNSRFYKDAAPLALARACLIGWEGDTLTDSQTVPFSALQGIPLVLPTRPSALRSHLDRVCKQKGVAFQSVLETNSVAVQRDLVLEGRAYTVMVVREAVHRDLEAGRLQASTILDPAIERMIVLRTTSHHPLSEAARVVARLARQLWVQERGEGMPSTGE